METSKADIKALRAFLDEHFRNTHGYRSTEDETRTANDICYIFTYVGGSAFTLRRIDSWDNFHDVLTFGSYQGMVEVKKKEAITYEDAIVANEVARALKQRPYGQLVSNLDSLLL